MVNTFSKGKVSAEEWQDYKDEDGDAAVKEKVKGFVELSEEKFGLHKEKYNLEKQKLIDQADGFKLKQQAAFDKSRENVINAFAEAKLPLDDKYLATVDKTINDQMILDLFKNPDGTLKDNVHQSIIMAQHGFDISQQLILAAKRQIASEQRTVVLERTPDTPAVKKTGTAESTEKQNAEQKMKSHVASVLGAKVAS